MSTSTDGVVLRGLAAGAVSAADTSTDLRGGEWTRFGSDSIRGDAVTEATLRGLTAQSREAARAQGFAAGWAEGRRGSVAHTVATHDEQVRAFDEQGRRVLAAQRSSADALVRALAAFEESTQAVLTELTDQAVELALQIAETVVGHELRSVDEAAADAVRRALRAVPNEVSVTVRLHPQDLAVAESATTEQRAGRRTVAFVADATVARGDAVVETESGSVDAGVASAMARVRQVLGR